MLLSYISLIHESEKSMTDHIWRVPIKTLGTSVYQYGEEACEGGHAFGPAVRDHFLLHFVTSGKGVFATEDKEYTVSAGEGFLISPDRVTSYRADAAEPWHYFWIGFSGQSAEELLSEIGLSPSSPVFSFKDVAAMKAVFDRVRLLPEDSVKAQLALVSVLYALLSGIEAKRDKSERGAYRLFHTGKEYADMAALYLEQRYASRITVGALSLHLGLHRSYFSTLFKKHYGVSPQEYLIRVRMDKARLLLGEGTISVADIARTVGYEDPLLFSRIFRKAVGISPSDYRKNMLKM